MLGTSAMVGGALGNLAAFVARPRRGAWRDGALATLRRAIPNSIAVAAAPMLLFGLTGGAMAGCSGVNAWVCTTTGTQSGSNPQGPLVPTDDFTVSIGQSGGTPDKYTMTNQFNSTHEAAVVVDNTNNYSGTITETASSVLVGNSGDGLRFYDQGDTGTNTITFNINGTLYGGNDTTFVTHPGDGLHIGQSGTHAPDVTSDSVIGTLNINVGNSNNTTAVIRGADDGLYIAQNIAVQATITNYGTINGKGVGTSSGDPNGENWGEGVHVSSVDGGVGAGYQVTGAVTVDNYGTIAGHANSGTDDDNGPGSGINISADGNISVSNGQSSAYQSSSITGTDGVVAYGGGTNDITLTNYGHIAGNDGEGANLSHADNITVDNHSLGSMIGSTTGQEISFANTTTYDNQGGLTAGLDGDGLAIHDIGGATSSAPRYSVIVDNTTESHGSAGGIIVGSANGINVYGIGNSVSYASGKNGVLIDNSGSGSGRHAKPGGLIVGETGNGVGVTGVVGDVTIDNSDTRNGAGNNLSTSAIDDAVGYDGNTTSTDPAGTTLLDQMVSGTGSHKTYALNYVLDGGYAPDPLHGGITTGIWGGYDGVYAQNIDGKVSVDNSNGQIFGQQGDGIQLWDIGASVNPYWNSTVVYIDNSDGGLVEGGVNGADLEGIQNGNVFYNNEDGATLGGNDGIYIGTANVSDVFSVAGSVTILNGDGGLIAGQNEDGIFATKVADDVTIDNSGDGWREDGGTIAGHYTGVAVSDIGGNFALDNEAGVTVGFNEDGVNLSGIGGHGNSEYGTVYIDNGDGGIIAGKDDGVSISDVNSRYTHGDVTVDNSASWNGHGFSDGGLIVGVDGDGVKISDVDNGDVTIDNQNTLETSINLNHLDDDALYGSRYSLLHGLANSADGNGHGTVGTGIFGDETGVSAYNIDGDATVNNEDGLIVGEDYAGVSLGDIRGDATVNNEGYGWSSGGAILGDNYGVKIRDVDGSASVDNAHGQIVAFGGTGVSISDVDGQGSGDTVDVENGHGGVIAGNEDGVSISDINTRRTGGDVVVDNSASWNGHGFTAGGLIVGVHGDGVKISDVDNGDVTIDNQNTLATSINLYSLDDDALYGSRYSLLHDLANSPDGNGHGTVGTGIFGDDSGVAAYNVDGDTTVNNQNGLIVGENYAGVSLGDIGGDATVNNEGYGWGSGGTILGDNYGVKMHDVDGSASVDNAKGEIIAFGGTGVSISDVDGDHVHHGDNIVDLDNSGGVIAGLDGDGVSISDVEGDHHSYSTYAVAVDNTATYHGHQGGIIAGSDNGLVISDITSESDSNYNSNQGIYVDNSGSASWSNNHLTKTPGGLIVGVNGDGIDVSDVTKGDGGTGNVTIDNSYTRDNGSNDLSPYGEDGLDWAVASTINCALSDAVGDDFLRVEPQTTGIWGLDGNGISGSNIAGVVSIDNVKGQIVGSDGSGIVLDGVGSGVSIVTNEDGEVTNSVVYIDNSSGSPSPWHHEGGLITGGDFGVKLSNIENGNVVLDNTNGTIYGDEMAFELGSEDGADGLTGGDVYIYNAGGMMEGHNGSDTADFGGVPNSDSMGAITIAGVQAADVDEQLVGGHVYISNGDDEGGNGGTIIGVSSASAISIGSYLDGEGNIATSGDSAVDTAAIYNGAPKNLGSENTESPITGGLIVGTGGANTPVILLNTSGDYVQGDAFAQQDYANGYIYNAGVIASTNLEGFVDPDTDPNNAQTDLRPFLTDAGNVGNYIESDGQDATLDAGDYQAALQRIDNNGAAGDNLIMSSVGGVSIDNDGVLLGTVNLTGFNNYQIGEDDPAVIQAQINNYGTWFTEGTNTVGTSVGAIYNEGLIQTAFAQSVEGTPSLSNTTFNVADFYNDDPGRTGALSALDGQAGDTITVNGNFHGGSYDAEHPSDVEVAPVYSIVALDAYLDKPAGQGGTPAGDLLHVTGNTDGVTALIINNTNTDLLNAGDMNSDGVQVVQVDGSTSGCVNAACVDGDAFYISSASKNYTTVNGIAAIQQGTFYAWYLTERDEGGPGQGGEGYYLVTDALPDSYQAPTITTGAVNIFYAGTDIVSDHLYGGHFPEIGSGGGGDDVTPQGPDQSKTDAAVWARVSGSWSNQGGTVDTGLGAVDTSYNQNTYTFLGGVDMSPGGEASGFRLGAFAGYVQSNLDFSSYGTTGKYSGGEFGGYAAYTQGGFYVDAQVDADILDVNYKSTVGGIPLDADTNGTTVGVLANIGNRFYRGANFFEPLASFSYANMSLDDMQSGGATVSFGDAESLRGGIGARLGTTLKNKDGSTTEFTVLGRLWNEFAGDNTVTISDGSNSNKFTNDIGGLYEEVSGTVTFASVNHLSVYVSGGGIFGADSTTWDAKAGVRKEF